LLKRGGYPITPQQDAALREWLLEVTEAVNSSFHCWTRWADLHPSSSAFERYRSDNHLSWALAGLLAAGIALEDDALVAYVLDGGVWSDRRGGAYANPSSMPSVIDWAIESGTGADNEGRVYEEKILRDPPIGYSLFHLWAMALVARMAQVHEGDDIWSLRGSDGGGLELAFDRYAEHILGVRPSPAPQQEGDLGFYAWQYELTYARWSRARHADVLDSTNRLTYRVQSIGPISLLVGEVLP
jgi:hypothetical protein